MKRIICSILLIFFAVTMSEAALKTNISDIDNGIVHGVLILDKRLLCVANEALKLYGIKIYSEDDLRPWIEKNVNDSIKLLRGYSNSIILYDWSFDRENTDNMILSVINDSNDDSLPIIINDFGNRYKKVIVYKSYDEFISRCRNEGIKKNVNVFIEKHIDADNKNSDHKSTPKKRNNSDTQFLEHVVKSDISVGMKEQFAANDLYGLEVVIGISGKNGEIDFGGDGYSFKYRGNTGIDLSDVKDKPIQGIATFRENKLHIFYPDKNGDLTSAVLTVNPDEIERFSDEWLKLTVFDNIITY